jgi:hypothetical protein
LALAAATFCVAGTFFLASPVSAHERAVQFDIQSQKLSTALLEFARQADAELLLPEAPLVGARSRDVHGVFAPSAALAHLLECTGFEGWIEDGIVRLRHAPEGTAPRLVVGPSPQRNELQCGRAPEQILVSDNGAWTDAQGPRHGPSNRSETVQRPLPYGPALMNRAPLRIDLAEDRADRLAPPSFGASA